MPVDNPDFNHFTMVSCNSLHARGESGLIMGIGIGHGSHMDPQNVSAPLLLHDGAT